MKKITKITAFVLLFVFSLIIGLLSYSNWLFPEWSGSYNLGNNLYMRDWDCGKIIMYCTGKRGKVCFAGRYVVPTYERRYDNSGNYSEMVENAKFNEQWIIVKSKVIKESKYYYYLIDKNFNVDGLDWNKSDSIIQNHITGPLDSLRFYNLLEERDIKLKLD